METIYLITVGILLVAILYYTSRVAKLVHLNNVLTLNQEKLNAAYDTLSKQYDNLKKLPDFSFNLEPIFQNSIFEGFKIKCNHKYNPILHAGHGDVIIKPETYKGSRKNIGEIEGKIAKTKDEAIELIKTEIAKHLTKIEDTNTTVSFRFD